jgi:hypothetical protein
MIGQAACAERRGPYGVAREWEGAASVSEGSGQGSATTNQLQGHFGEQKTLTFIYVCGLCYSSVVLVEFAPFRRSEACVFRRGEQASDGVEGARSILSGEWQWRSPLG